MASSSPISLLAIQTASLGSTLVTGTGWYNGNFGALNTVGGSGFAIAAASGNNITNISALNGFVFPAPSQFIGNITTVRLSSGVCQAVRQL